MAQKSKSDLKNIFVNGHVVTQADMADLIDSMKSIQSAVSSPTASGSTTSFIDSISQDAEGKIIVTKKNVNFSGYVSSSTLTQYQKKAEMANYQTNDIQRVGSVNKDNSGVAIVTTVSHNKGHYPTVRVIDGNGVEVPRNNVYFVRHVSINVVEITLSANANTGNATYSYILD